MTEADSPDVSQVPAHFGTDGSFCSRGGQYAPGGQCPDGHDHADHYSNDGHPECEERLPLSELVARAQNSTLTDPTWRTDYRT